MKAGKTVACGLAASFAVVSAAGAPRLVADGVLGQSGERKAPVGFSDCALCLADGTGGVLLSDGWRIPKEGGVPRQLALPKVPGQYLGDGRELWHWNASSRWMKRMRVTDDSLAESEEKYHLGPDAGQLLMMPHGVARGFGAKGRFFLFDRRAMTVKVWKAADGRFEEVFRYGEKVENAAKVCAAGFHPASGDLVLAFDWPLSCVRRYAPDGSEHARGAWPARVLARSIAYADGRAFAIGYSARELGDSTKGLAFGADCYSVSGLARGRGGWWLGTTQGAQFYPDAMIAKADEPAARRVGGLVGVDALALSGGRVLVCQGPRIQSLWLDDRRDEPLSSDRKWMNGFNYFDGRVTSIDVLEDGSFRFSFESKGGVDVWRFDPRKVWYGESKSRIVKEKGVAAPTRPVNEAKLGRYRAVAEDGELRLYDGSKCVWSKKLGVTLLAAEGDRLIAYLPKIFGIIRFRLKDF